MAKVTKKVVKKKATRKKRTVKKAISLDVLIANAQGRAKESNSNKLAASTASKAVTAAARAESKVETMAGRAAASKAGLASAKTAAAKAKAKVKHDKNTENLKAARALASEAASNVKKSTRLLAKLDASYAKLHSKFLKDYERSAVAATNAANKPPVRRKRKVSVKK